MRKINSIGNVVKFAFNQLMNELMIVVGSSSLPVPNAFDAELLLFPLALRQARDGSLGR